MAEGSERKLVLVEQDLEDRCELFLQEIEAVDDYWGPTFRAIYADYKASSASSDSELPQLFLRRLEARVMEHDASLERMCNHHYQGFISAVRELLQMRSDAAALRADVVKIDEDVRKSADILGKATEQLVQARQVQLNLSSAIDRLSLCLPVLQRLTKLHKQLEERRYHPALKSLEQLEHTFLPRISTYRFARPMTEAIPRLRLSIRENSLNELKDFLEQLRQRAPKVGHAAMAATAARIGREQPEKEKKFQDFVGNASSLSVDASPEDVVDFSAVYKCQHIYSVLGEREAFEKYYRKQRRQQALLVLQQTPSMNTQDVNQSLDGYTTFFEAIVGFFVCEDHVLNTGSGVVTKAYLEELWDTTASRIMTVVQSATSDCNDSSLMVRLKDQLLLLSFTLSNLGFSASNDKLSLLLRELRDHYVDVLRQQWVDKFKHIFQVDNYHPLQVEGESDLSNLRSSFPLDSSLHTIEDGKFPLVFPFSAMVPKVYLAVQQFILKCYDFSAELSASDNPDEMDNSMRKATNDLLTRTLSGCLSNLVRKGNLSLIQLIQIDINTYHLEETNVHLEKYISALTGSSHESTHIARLQGRSIFKDLRVEVEEAIHSKLLSKMDAFLELASYDWLMQDALGQASPWLTDLIAFLNSVFLSFTNLPIKLAQMTCMSALQHLARSLLAMLLDENVKAVSLGLLQQMDLDLVQCEQFAASEPVPGLEEGVLLLSFVDVRQLLDLFVSWDWSTYLADQTQRVNGLGSSKYNRVKPETALAVLEKLREAEERRNSILFRGNKKERDKKRLVDTVFKQLKAITNNNNE